MTGKHRNGRRARGFTLVELLLVLFVVAMLASLVAPMVTSSIQRARESTLREDLRVLRKAIDDYYGDTGKYPESLETLAEKRYIRKVPVDPITDRADSWIAVRGEDTNSGVMDVRSGSDEQAADGSRYQDW